MAEISNIENILNKKAWKSAKELEKKEICLKVENLLKKKIDLLKELENCKLEIDSGRKKEKSTQFNQVFFKENGQISEEKKKNIKETSEKEKNFRFASNSRAVIMFDSRTNNGKNNKSRQFDVIQDKSL